jgi:HD-like signal output (HDOD) protein
VAQVIAEAGSPRSDSALLASLIGQDPMLAAKVLQIANGAAYAKRGPVSNLSDAVRNIGCATIRNIAMTLGIFDVLSRGADDAAGGFSPIRCWQHSFAVARLTEKLAAGSDAAAIAYMVGLCHDLGHIIFHTHFQSEYRQVLDLHLQTGKPREDLERITFGLTQSELVIEILRHLGLPKTISDPIEAFHRGRLTKGIGGRLVMLLQMADLCANALQLTDGEMPIASFSKSHCRTATGDDAPAAPEAAAFRSEVLALTCMLARLSAADEAKATVPLFPKTTTRVWLARDSSLSSFDPIATALGLMAEVQVANRLPNSEESASCDALIVSSCTTSVAGLTSRDLEAANGVQRPLPLLWLSGQAATSSPVPQTAVPLTWPIPLDKLAAFIASAAAGIKR